MAPCPSQHTQGMLMVVKRVDRKSRDREGNQACHMPSEAYFDVLPKVLAFLECSRLLRLFLYLVSSSEFT